MKFYLLLPLCAIMSGITQSCLRDSSEAYTPPIYTTAVVSRDEVWVLTRKGSLLRVAADGSVTKPEGTPPNLRNISVLGRSSAWGVDSNWNVWRFDGERWTYAGHNDETTFGPSGRAGLSFADERIGWARTLEPLFLTDDGGKTWKKVLVTGPGELLQMYVINRNTVILYGYGGQMSRTTDRGRSWRSLDLGTKHDVTSLGCRDVDGQECWAASGSDVFAISGDAIRHLSMPPQLGDVGFFSIFFSEPGQALLAGGTYGEHPAGILLRTQDDGKTWENVPVPTDKRFRNVARFGLTIWLSSDTSVYRSTDEGASWETVYQVSADE